MTTTTAPAIRLDIETTPGPTGPWDTHPNYKFTISQETSTGWTTLTEQTGYTTTETLLHDATTALQHHSETLTTPSPEHGHPHLPRHALAGHS